MRLDFRALQAVRGGIALAVTGGDRAAARMHSAARGWGAGVVSKAAVTATQVGDIDTPSTGLGSREFTEAVRELSVLGRLRGIRRGIALTRSVASGGIGAAFISEGAPIPVRQLSFTNGELDTAKVAALVVQSREAFELGGDAFQQMIAADLAGGLIQAVDVAFLDPTNSGAGSAPPSVTSGVTPVAGSANAAADLRSLAADFAGDFGSAYLVMRPSLAVALSGAGFRDVGARGGEAAGLPVITTRHSPSGQIALIDASGILMTDAEIGISAAEQATVELDDAPDGAAPFASFFQLNLRGIRAIWPASWLKLRADAVSLVSSATW